MFGNTDNLPSMFSEGKKLSSAAYKENLKIPRKKKRKKNS